MPYITNSFTNKTCCSLPVENTNAFLLLSFYFEILSLRLKKKKSFIHSGWLGSGGFLHGIPSQRHIVSHSVCGSGWECGTLSSPKRNNPCGALRGLREMPVLRAQCGRVVEMTMGTMAETTLGSLLGADSLGVNSRHCVTSAAGFRPPLTHVPIPTTLNGVEVPASERTGRRGPQCAAPGCRAPPRWWPQWQAVHFIHCSTQTPPRNPGPPDPQAQLSVILKIHSVTVYWALKILYSSYLCHNYVYVSLVASRLWKPWDSY